ncbi:ATP-sensitive inward rectifier potassium channel 12 isoform X1 [Halyomorpha halys]|uniref:ATP-sensitive inward rectifier potassium channel 12 isoform X1 n=1 Tax=Halyomorpha halys TaxID=286706 RepID=UPI000D0C8399|nr:ATP-sensitive inward rectifier potassium channel 12-like isoform X1 [Halyomorpha halys]
MVSTQKECNRFTDKDIMIEEANNDDELKCLSLKEKEEYYLFQRSRFRRSVRKTGHCALPRKSRNSRLSSLSNYLKDPFTYLVEIRWRNLILLYITSFVGSWFVFGIFWWIIAYAHGDLAVSPYAKTEIEPCITMMPDFISAFLFSLETQYTTGYGTRAPTTECPEAIFLLSFQSIFGVLLQSVMVGAVFAKLARPKNRGHAISYSKKAVICMREGKLCFMFRLGDENKSYVSDCKIKAWLIQTKVTKEGEFLPNYVTKLKVSADDAGDSIFLLWPVTVVHRIDTSSPLFDLSPLDLMKSDIEIVVSLVCTAETTGQQTEVRCSYAPCDILWGHRFRTILESDSSGFIVDFSKFDETESLDMPLCSAKQLELNIKPNTNGDINEICLSEK